MSAKRPNRESHASRKYHDRVASRYDAMYEDPYWDFHDRVTWNHLKRFLPTQPGAPVLDLGCGTGKWGLKLLKAAFAVTFVDHSGNMLNGVRDKLEAWKQQPDLAAKVDRATVVQADALDLGALPADHFALVTAMGDVVSICADAAKSLSEMHRVLAPGGVAVFTVDNKLSAIDHFVTGGDMEKLASFVKTGRTQWLTQDRAEQFDLRMFSPEEITALVKARGFDLASMIGKTIIPARRNKMLFESEDAIEDLVKLETLLARDAFAMARASHLQIAARKRAADA